MSIDHPYCFECGQPSGCESLLLRIIDHVESTYPESWRTDTKFEEMIAEGRNLLGLEPEKHDA